MIFSCFAFTLVALIFIPNRMGSPGSPEYWKLYFGLGESPRCVPNMHWTHYGGETLCFALTSPRGAARDYFWNA
jgi:hypothetical protein